MREQSDKVPEDVRGEVESKIADLKEILESDDEDRLKQMTEELQESLQKVGAAMYEQPEAEAAAPPPDDEQEEGAGAEEEDVIDGEFSEEE